MNEVAQFFGFIALLLLVMSYQQQKKLNFLFIQIFAYISYVFQYSLLGAYSAVIIDIISMIRSLLFYNNEKKKRSNSFFQLILLQITMIGFGIFFSTNIYSILPIIIGCLFTYGCFQNNLKRMYLLAILCSLLWLVYNIFVGAYISIFANIIELIASICGYYKIKRKNKNSN